MPPLPPPLPMNYYATLYAGSIIASLVCGAMIYRRYRNPSGFFFFLFTLCVSAWFVLYFAFFAGIGDIDTLLLISRLDFGMWVISASSLFFFVYFFDTKTHPLSLRTIGWIGGGYLGIILIYTTNDLMIAGLQYSPEEMVYREILGPLFPLHVALHLGNIAGIVYFAFRQLRKQIYLNRVRFKHIVSAAALLIWAGLVFQLILPLFGIWIFEQELILLYVFFTAYTLYILRRYYFSSIGYGIGRLFVFVLSLTSAIVITYLIRVGYWELWNGVNIGYWWSRDDYSIVDITLGVTLFQIIHRFGKRVFLTHTYREDTKKQIRQAEQVISYTTDLPDLSTACSRELRRIFRTNVAEIRLFDRDNTTSELRRYFEHELSDRIFIRDIVFMEEQKIRFDRDKILKEVSEEVFLIIPISSANRKTIGLLSLGVKPFGDFYTIEEIRLLQSFAEFLDRHLRYIDIYGQIRDLSVNLDKKVDEKTMEYNNLLNKQKEFISLISHEVKSPIANAVFQADSILDDLSSPIPSLDAAKTELRLLNTQLQDTGELISKLFSVQYYDTHDVSLFREKVRLSYLLQTEYEVYSRMHEDIDFINEIDPDMGFVDLDRIQFQQVITNLLNNAVKFRNISDASILIHAHRQDDQIYVRIEDNGRWFQGIDVSELFTRYSRGGGWSVGLGIGLYLCKKIIDMHHGEIRASVSESLGWARFDLRIPAH